MEHADLAGIQLAGGPSGVDSRPPERFVGVDVSNPRERSLVEECCLHRGSPPRESLGQAGCGKSRLEGFQAETGGEVGV